MPPDELDLFISQETEEERRPRLVNAITVETTAGTAITAVCGQVRRHGALCAAHE